LLVVYVTLYAVIVSVGILMFIIYHFSLVI